jgi:hypothetical protein
MSMNTIGGLSFGSKNGEMISAINNTSKEDTFMHEDTFVNEVEPSKEEQSVSI